MVQFSSYQLMNYLNSKSLCVQVAFRLDLSAALLVESVWVVAGVAGVLGVAGTAAAGDAASPSPGTGDCKDSMTSLERREIRLSMMATCSCDELRFDVLCTL